MDKSVTVDYAAEEKSWVGSLVVASGLRERTRVVYKQLTPELMKGGCRVVAVVNRE